MKTRFLAALAATLAVGGSAQAAQLLVNGDFDAGAVGFYSDYGHAADHNLWPEGMYDTVRNPIWTHSHFLSMADHTPGADFGRMMVVNGRGVADSLVWAQGDIGGGASLNGAAGSAFTFSFWMATVVPVSPANLQLWVNGDKVGGATFAAVGGQADLGLWRQYSYSGIAGIDGLRSIGLTDLNLAANGNDFALDDMSLLAELTPPPAPPPVFEPPPIVEPPPPQAAPPADPPYIPPAVEPPPSEPPLTGSLPPEPPEPPVFEPPVFETPPFEPPAYAQAPSEPAGGAVPEPASWLLMICGFAAVGALLRRRARPLAA